VELWGKDDYFARWIHAICAVPLVLFIAFNSYLIYNGIFSGRLTVASCPAAFFSYRLLKYALMGRDNINKDDY